MIIPQLITKETATVERNVFKRAKDYPYAFILVRKLLQNDGWDINNRTHTCFYNEIKIPMIPREH